MINILKYSFYLKKLIYWIGFILKNIIAMKSEFSYQNVWNSILKIFYLHIEKIKIKIYDVKK